MSSRRPLESYLFSILRLVFIYCLFLGFAKRCRRSQLLLWRSSKCWKKSTSKPRCVLSIFLLVFFGVVGVNAVVNAVAVAVSYTHHRLVFCSILERGSGSSIVRKAKHTSVIGTSDVTKRKRTVSSVTNETGIRLPRHSMRLGGGTLYLLNRFLFFFRRYIFHRSIVIGYIS